MQAADAVSRAEILGLLGQVGALVVGKGAQTVHLVMPVDASPEMQNDVLAVCGGDLGDRLAPFPIHRD